MAVITLYANEIIVVVARRVGTEFHCQVYNKDLLDLARKQEQGTRLRVESGGPKLNKTEARELMRDILASVLLPKP